MKKLIIINQKDLTTETFFLINGLVSCGTPLSLLRQNSTSSIYSTCLIPSHFQPIIQHPIAFNQLMQIEIQQIIMSTNNPHHLHLSTY